MKTHVENPAAQLSEEISRYARHLITPEVGMAGQLRLKQARVLQIGAGGLGSPITIYLAAAGVGKLGVVDADVVEVSNLQRQVLHGTSDVGRGLPAGAQPSAGIQEITARELRVWIEEGKTFVLIDVREPAEFAAGRIATARSLPRERLLHHLHEMTWADEIVIYSGPDCSSQKAAEKLQRFGFRKVRVLRGGFQAWAGQGYPAEQAN